MTDSWRMTLAKLQEVIETRDLTVSEQRRLKDALRKAKAERDRKTRSAS